MSEPEGFLVRLSSLENFAGTVAAVCKDYEVLSEPLDAADLSKHNPAFDGLLGLSRLPGSRAANDACKSALGAYSALYGKVAWAQTVIKSQLDVIAANIAATHQLYHDVEDKQHHVFRGMSDTFGTGPAAGGENGSAGQG